MLPNARKISIKQQNLSPDNQKLIEAVYANLDKRIAAEKAALAKLPARK